MFVDNAMRQLVAKMANEYGWFFGRTLNRDSPVAGSVFEGKAAGTALSLFNREAASWLSRLDPCTPGKIDCVLDGNSVFVEQVFLNGKAVSQKCAPDARAEDLFINGSVNLRAQLGIDADVGVSENDLKIRAGNAFLRRVLRESGMTDDDFDHLARLAMDLAPRMGLFRRLSDVCARRLEENFETAGLIDDWDGNERDMLQNEAILALSSCGEWPIRQKALDEAFVIRTWVDDGGEISRFRCYDMDSLPDEIREDALELRDLKMDRDGHDFGYVSKAAIMRLDLTENCAPMPDGSEYHVETLSVRQILKEADLDSVKIMREAASLHDGLQAASPKKKPGLRP